MPKEFDPRVTAYVRANLPSRLPQTQTIKQQSETIGVSDATLHDVLFGDGTIGKKTLPRFAAALGLSVDNLVAEARRAAPPDPPSEEVVQEQESEREPSDTLEMADLAAKDLTALDSVKPQQAWAVMRSIRLASPSVRAFYVEARRRLGGEPTERSAGTATLPADRKRSASSKAKKLFEGPDYRSGVERGGAKK